MIIERGLKSPIVLCAVIATQLLLFYDAVADHAPFMANRVLAPVRGMLNSAVAHEPIASNPAALVKKPSPERTRERVLNFAEIRALWAALNDLSPTVRRVFKTRLSEAAKWYG